MGDRGRKELSDSEPFERSDGSWGVATYRHGVRDIVGRFQSRQDALTWIKKGIGTESQRQKRDDAPTLIDPMA